MTKKNPDSDLLREGYKSYHKAVFAVMEFRREAGKIIRAAIEERVPELAAAMKLDENELREQMCPYAEPDRLTQKYDGSKAGIGVRIPKSWKSKWHVYFYIWTSDDGEPQVIAEINFKNSAPEFFDRIEVDEYYGNSGWISEIVPSDGSRDLVSVCNRVLNRWVALWKKVGGLRQFLPKTV